jgi:hypothetical protein
MHFKFLSHLLGRIGSILFLVSTLSSCGIDSIAFLGSKVTLASSGPSSSVFLAPSVTEDNYLGVFLFYRIYASEVLAETDKNNVYNKQNVLNAVPGTIIESYLLSPGGLKYKKLTIDGDVPIPSLYKSLIPINTLVSIDFPTSTSVEPKITILKEASATISYIISRSITGTTGSYLSFRDKALDGQDDYLASTVDPDPNVDYIQFFAVTYGINQNSLQELYGDAVYIGRITLNL